MYCVVVVSCRAGQKKKRLSFEAAVNWQQKIVYNIVIFNINVILTYGWPYFQLVYDENLHLQLSHLILSIERIDKFKFTAQYCAICAKSGFPTCLTLILRVLLCILARVRTCVLHAMSLSD